MKSEHDFRSCNEQLKRLKKNLKKIQSVASGHRKGQNAFPGRDWIFNRLGLFYCENRVTFI